MKKFDGKVALVVAATRGIGLACAQGLAREGARVYLGVRRLEAGQEVADQLQAEGFYAAPVYFNAYELEPYEKFIQEVVDKEGRIDILINNYGGSNVKEDLDVVNTSVEYFNKNTLTNLVSVYLPVK